MKRSRVSRHDRKIFRRSASTTKAINLGARAQRGGVRL